MQGARGAGATTKRSELLFGFGGKITERAGAAFAMRGFAFEASARGASFALRAGLAFGWATLTLRRALAFALSGGLGLGFAFAFATERGAAERLATVRVDFGFGSVGFVLARATRAAALFVGFFEFLGIPITRREAVTTNTVRYRNTVVKCIALAVLDPRATWLRARLAW